MAQLSSQQKPTSKAALKVGLVLCFGFGILDLGILNFWAAPAAFSPSVQTVGMDVVAQAGTNSTGEKTPTQAQTAGQKAGEGTGQELAAGAAQKPAPTAETKPEEPSEPKPEEPKPGPAEPEEPVKPVSPPTEKPATPPAEPVEPPRPPAPTIPSKIVIYFDTARHSLNPKGTNELTRLARLLRAAPGRSIRISGHTDSRGDGEYNQRLSTLRAEEVSAFLKRKRVEAKIVTEGLGDQYPAGTGNTARTLALNRRVELKISQGDQ